MKIGRRKLVVIIAILAIILVVGFFLFQNHTKQVEVLAVAEKPYAEKIIALGQLSPRQEISLIAEVSGTVGGFYAEEGETIPAEELVLEIENQVTSEYDAAKSELNRVNSIVATAKTDYSNAQILFEEGAISKAELTARKNTLESAISQQKVAQLSLEIALDNAGKYEVRSPWDAVILKAYAKAGDYIKAGQTLAYIGSVDGYKITAEVDEKYYYALEKGMPVLISTGGNNFSQSRGEINSITPKINENTGTFEIGIDVPESFPYLASNLTVNLEILLLEEESAIVIPENYLVAQGESPEQYKGFVLLYKDGRVKKQELQIVPGFGANVLVSSGLSEGDMLIYPQEDLQEGDAVKPSKEGSTN